MTVFLQEISLGAMLSSMLDEDKLFQALIGATTHWRRMAEIYFARRVAGGGYVQALLQVIVSSLLSNVANNKSALWPICDTINFPITSSTSCIPA